MLDYSKIGSAAAESEDLTVNKVYERQLPVAGVAFAVFKDYIELGRHKSSNPTHKPALKAILVFELNHPKHMIEVDGKKVPQQIMVRVNKGDTAKSGFRKLFNVMNAAYDNKYNHFAQMLGKPFLAEIFHNESGEGDKKQTYANMDKDGAWSFKAPFQIDAITETKTALPIAPLVEPSRLFLWEPKGLEDSDIIAMWDSIFIDGEREVEDKATGTKKMVSKNWIQESIITNLEWEGSVTHALTSDNLSLDENPAAKAEPTLPSELTEAGDVPSLDD